MPSGVMKDFTIKATIANRSKGVKSLPIRSNSFCGLIDSHRVIAKKIRRKMVKVVCVGSPKNGLIAIS